PFIARYRKDRTGNLDEVVIEQIAKLNQAFQAIVKRKEAILKSIEEQNGLTPDLKHKIDASFDMTELEHFYLPFKKRKKTKADTGRENGLEPMAKIIMAQNSDENDYIASKYINDKVANDEDALQGARDFIAEWVNETLYIRKNLKRMYNSPAEIT